MPRRSLPPKINWGSLERTLLQLTEADLRRFAKRHAHETFYGFAFDCNSEYGEVGLCLNTKELLKAQREAPDPNAAFFASLDRKLGLDSDSGAMATRVSRWDLGDWGYQACNSRTFDRGLRRFQAIVTERCMLEDEDQRTFMKPTQTRFMKAACRVLLRLERRGAFDVLRRTGNFSTLARDHDEAESIARWRLRRQRRLESGA